MASQLQKPISKGRKTYAMVNPLTGDSIVGDLQQLSQSSGLSKYQLNKIIKNKGLIPNFDSPVFIFKNKNQADGFIGNIKENITKNIKKPVSIADFYAFDPDPLALEATGDLYGFKNIVKPETTGKDDSSIKFEPSGELWKNNKYNTINQSFTLEGGNFDDPYELFDAVNSLMDNLKDNLNLKDNDKVRLSYKTSSGKYISTKYQYVNDFEPLAPDDIQDSHKESQGMVYEDADVIGVDLFVVRNPYTGGRGTVVNDKSKIYSKKSIIRIKNDDDLCLGRCLVIAHAKKEDRKDYKQIAAGRKIQDVLTHKLYEDAGVEKSIGSLTKIKQFEKFLDCCITVIDADNFNNVIYPDTKSSDYELKDFNIYLYKNGTHYDLINSNKIAGFFGSNYFCCKCKKTYGNKDKHKCSFKCNICCSSDCDSMKIFDKSNSLKPNWIDCKNCNRKFPSQKCFDNHIEPDKNGLSLCDKIFKCCDCNKVFDKKVFNFATHKCGDTFCKNCKQVVGENHRCYMFPQKLKESSEKYIFFDFEARQETGKHIVNYCIAQYFDNPDPIEFFDRDSFCKWLIDEKHKGYSIIAHNGKGYDYQFIMRWIYRHTTYKPSIVYAGSKIMTFKINQGLNIRFVDSLNFLTMPLEAFPKTFGIKELKKGFFPHFFNTEENKNYIGPMPDIEYFKHNSFKDKKRAEFLEWYADKIENNYVWNQQKEMREYCISDVDILRRCCIQFRELYLKIADIDPFQYTTIASVCMAIFKSKHIHDIDYENTDDDEIRKIVFENKKISILTYEEQQFIRKSFFGGRTNATKLKYNFKESEHGVYADITSLYPTVNYYDEYPTGDPITVENITPDIIQGVLDKKYFGFIDCYVECPKDLYFPVLAEKGKKLLFNLENKRGVWSSVELYKAMDMGYKVKNVYKILYYEKQTKDLFKSYVNKFLKIKQEASGYPDWVKTEDDKDKYIKKYKAEQGIQLDKENIKYNPGLRAIAKLCLNSLWGKFGMRLNMAKTEIINDSRKFTNIMFDDDKYKDQDFYFVGNQDEDNRIEMRYKLQDKYIDLDFNTNLSIASFTTSHARLRLYEGLELLNHQVLYHDTDSIVYVKDENNKDHKTLELGDNLGEWTDELEGGKMKGTFISGGPKNYSYEKHKTDKHGKTKITYETKIKGFCLSYDIINELRDDKTGKLIRKGLNHKTMIDIVDDRFKKDNDLKIDYTQIVRKKDKSLMTVNAHKTYQFCYDKRHICNADADGNIDTLPFGHKNIIN